MNGKTQQPDNSLGLDGDGENCVYLLGNKTGHTGWNDFPCSLREHQFVCSKSICLDSGKRTRITEGFSSSHIILSPLVETKTTIVLIASSIAGIFMIVILILIIIRWGNQFVFINIKHLFYPAVKRSALAGKWWKRTWTTSTGCTTPLEGKGWMSQGWKWGMKTRIMENRFH